MTCDGRTKHKAPMGGCRSTPPFFHPTTSRFRNFLERNRSEARRAEVRRGGGGRTQTKSVFCLVRRVGLAPGRRGPAGRASCARAGGCRAPPALVRRRRPRPAAALRCALPLGPLGGGVLAPLRPLLPPTSACPPLRSISVFKAGPLAPRARTVVHAIRPRWGLSHLQT